MRFVLLVSLARQLVRRSFFGREIELWGVCAWLLVKGFSGLRLGVRIVTVLWVCGYWWSFVTKDWAWL